MTCLTRPLPGTGTVPVLMLLPQPLTAQALRDLEHALADALATRGRDPSAANAADLEYASWMPDPGAIEVASWAAHLRPSVR
ncbi:MAG: hypothetical protein IV088_25480 [Hydrogenophaga sp.]|uniref:hypothetical protein n=1 Tax=Hydrogenophaga sp. TaxID=1904254 RepID=UPI0025B8BD88|nr:hypothetical protein [Hydrogenophaga sp.]MBT9554208.1 hypothetical protein [Hydrogenophaga sp.]